MNLSIAELKAACPGADNDFLVEQALNAATIDDVKNAFIAEQSRTIDRLNEQLRKRRPGVPPRD